MSRADEPARGPVDFLARLELLENAEGTGPPACAEPAAAPFAPAPFAAPPFHGGAVKPRPAVNDGGAAASQVIEELRQMEQQLDELRSKKRERTPPEQHVGGAPQDL